MVSHGGIKVKKVYKIIFIVLVVVGLICGGYYIIKSKPNKTVISFSDELHLVVEDIIIEEGEPVIIEGGEIYLSFDVISKYVDTDLYYDEDEEMIIVTDKTKVRRYKVNGEIATVNSKEFIVDHPIISINQRVYLPVEIFEDYEIEVEYYPDTHAVVMDYTDIYYLSGEVIMEGASIRTDLHIKAPLLAKDLELGSILNIYGEYEDWYKVRTKDGILGFVEKRYMKVNHTKDIYKTELWDKEDGDAVDRELINLTWDYTYRKLQGAGSIKPIPGVNIISPTWFSIVGANGEIMDKGNRDYVSQYRNLGYEIWPLIDNDFNPELTHELLRTSSNRERLINDILDIYLDYGFQGINIDFENVDLKDRDLLTQFVRELYPMFKEHNMWVSMAVTPISVSENWSLSFDRIRLMETTDYLMLMAYDQHWATSPIAGSVAQYSWVEDSLIRVLEQIPKGKLILSIPYYTRLWTIEGEKVSSQALSMESANDFINEKHMELIWDEESMQYYGKVEEGDKIYKIWIEDSKSLEAKVSLVHKYDLAGVASWRKGFETEDIWTSIDKILN